MDLKAFPILRLLIPIIIGIVIAEYDILDYALISIFLLILFYSGFRRKVRPLITWILFLGIGYLLHAQLNESFLVAKMSNIENICGIVEYKKLSPKAQILTVKNISSPSTKFLIYTPLSVQINIGDTIFSNKSPTLIKNKENPLEFDYEKYCKHLRISHSAFLKKEDFAIRHAANFNILKSSFNIKQDILSILKIYFDPSGERDIIFSIGLGHKDELNRDIKQSFINTGAMHVMAVSGLHVGLIFFIISGMLSIFKRINPSIHNLTIILCISTYAYITGLSPSVVRASIMLSIFLIAGPLSRKK